MTATRRLNWPAWSGLLLAVFALISYPTLFVRFPTTRNVPWANVLLYAITAVLLVIGLRRAFRPEGARRGRIGASFAASIGLVSLAFFVLGFAVLARNLPASHEAPQVGQKAPDFQLANTENKTVTLEELLSSSVAGKPAKGVLLVFYRGYW